MDIGKRELLANINGRLIRFTIAICVSCLVDLKASARNTEDSPTLRRNIAAYTPKMLSGVKVELTCNPKITASIRIIVAWNIDLKPALRTFENIIAPLDTGVLRTLFKNPKRLSQTIDMPLNIVVNITMKEIIPTDM